jgi:hypothetical protein
VLVPWSPFEQRLQVAAGRVLFEAREEITVLPVQLQTWIKQPLPDDQQSRVESEAFGDLNALLEEHLKLRPGSVTLQAADTYEAVPLPPVQEGLLPSPISTHQTVDGWLWLALLAPEPLLQGPSRQDDLRRQRLVLAEQVLSLGVRIDGTLCGSTDHLLCPQVGAAPTRWPLEWQISTGRFRGQTRRVDQALYLRLEVLQDGTASFSRNGSVRLRLPPNGADGTAGLGSWSAESFDPPDPDLLGIGELPPRLEDERDAARVLAWIRVRRRDPSHPPLKPRWLEVNVLPVEQAITATAPELLGYGDGRPGQELRLSQTPVLPDSADIQVAAASGGGDPLAWQSWRAIEDLALAGADDPVFHLDAESGTIRFGDGLHGRIPLPGEAIRCRSYRHGGGADGNVGASRISRIQSVSQAVLADLKVSNPLAAEGGADAETVAQASVRLPRMLRHNDRAVGRDDFSDLALETPCAGIGRAHCLPRHLPHQRLDGIAGVVTLIVIPAYDPIHPDEPMPDRDQLRRVCAWLEPRRLVTTELYITPPTYVRLSVSVAVEAEADVGEETLRRQVELALRQLLAPLPPFGPDGQGWPFGRDVGERDLEAAVLRVQGVRLVNGVLLSAAAVDALGRAATTTPVQRLPLETWQLPSLQTVQVTVGPDSAPEPLPLPQPDPPPAPPAGIPVPVKREVC